MLLLDCSLLLLLWPAIEGAERTRRLRVCEKTLRILGSQADQLLVRSGKATHRKGSTIAKCAVIGLKCILTLRMRPFQNVPIS